MGIRQSSFSGASADDSAGSRKAWNDHAGFITLTDGKSRGLWCYRGLVIRAVLSSDGESLQFGFAPLQDADIFKKPFDAISVERRDDLPFDRANGVRHGQ